MSPSSSNVQQCMKQVMKNYDCLRGKKICPDDDFWDFIVISAADEEQQEIFELQINHKKSAGELPLNVPFLVVSDPEGVKIGNGGSTFHVLQILYRKLEAELFSKRVLLIHAGGSSKRLPTASVLGKIFCPLPIGNPSYQMLDLKLALYLPFASHLQPGICLVCSDDIETYFLKDINKISNDWPADLPDFLAVGHKGRMETGENHGVYVLPSFDGDVNVDASFHICSRVMQKPKRQTMLEKGAVLKDGDVCTDSVFFFSHEVTKTLLEFYPKIHPLTCEVDAYRDFLQALGSSADKDYVFESDDEQRTVQTQLFNLLNPFPLYVLFLKVSRFYHLGTCSEYINNLTRGGNQLFSDLDMCSFIDSRMSEVESSDLDREQFLLRYPSVTIMRSIISQSLIFNGPSVIEYCELGSSIDVGEYCLLSNCCCSYEKQLKVPSFTLLHTIPITVNKNEFYVTIAFGIHDDFKTSFSKSKIECLTYFGKSVYDLQKFFGCASAFSLFEEKVKSFSLWNVKLFQAVQNIDESFITTLNFLLTLKSGEKNPSVNDAKSQSRFSMSNIIKYKDTRRMLKLRTELQEKIHKF